MERRGGEINFETIDAQEFGKLLEKFYCEVRPGKNGDLYHRNTIINIRAGINRKLTDLKRNIDVVKDKEFKTANGVLDGLLKERMRDGTAICTKHKDIIEKEDMKKITSYFKNASLSPVILRHCVYFQLAIHFVSRGIEFHCQLKQDSFTFHKDETGEYVTLNPDTLQKNRQSSVDEFAMQTEKRMYATGGDSCPVMMLRLLLEKTEPTATSLFNKVFHDAVTLPKSCSIWYRNSQLSKRTISNFMRDMSKIAGLSRIYTGQCLRTTVIQILSEEGYEDRDIFFMSHYRNEKSLHSSRHPPRRKISPAQKKSLSITLSSITDPTTSETNWDS